MVQKAQAGETPAAPRHAVWVRVAHWLVTISFLILAVTGVVILMAHPRLYWGEVGNELTEAWVELPISRNHRHGGWAGHQPFRDSPDSPISASRTYDIFNQNGWGRSLHFLAAWILVAVGAFYLLAGIFMGHFARDVVPRAAELAPSNVWRDVKDHLRLRIPAATGGPLYGLLQKTAYLGIIFLALPLMFLTGMAMSPAVTSSLPFLLDVFGGYQSARTIHFLAFVTLVIFLIVHVALVVKSGLKTQIRGMTIGGKNE